MVHTIDSVLPIGKTAAWASIGLPIDGSMKSIESCHVQVDDKLIKVQQATGEDWVYVPQGVPTLYVINWADQLLEWNADVQEHYAVKLRYSVFTTLPDNLSEEIWLTQNASDVLLYQAVVQFAMAMRDVELAQSYAAMRDQGLRTLALQQEAQEQTNSEIWMGRVREPY
jgi:hypothetical protein